ncbi:glucosaminidase domain-containing protein [Alicyclobacillus dauci]|uniref:Glucosaminidase domain-containing protein n=1 Tax=Alicyclobacillus dauci TaxID=1475485 RepID=A0ABY6Z722_9BACL|nr:glucosaminidase domain-containing protein [Alicyclobacillus dauci]WAH38627.1 glucosaminidase domain-containing protein [Alicyclobacillus dauci]
MTPQQFISAIAPSAVAFMRAHKISAALIIAQGALESGWGKTAQAMGNNLFGIKADSSWSGPITMQQTKEFVQGQWQTITAKFRAYPSTQACLEDHDGFLLQPRYRNLIGADYATACRLIGAVDGYATDPNYGSQLLEIIKEYDLAKYDKEATQVTYQSAKARVNGKDVLAVGVNDVTYLIWTVARDTGCNLTKVAPGDVEIDSKKPPQVFDGKNTYVEWSAIPTIDPHPIKDANGVWQFKTKASTPAQPTAPTPSEPDPVPVTHDYQIVVTQPSTAIAGRWALTTIQTLDNGKPLGNQIITVAENGVQVARDYTDAIGGYEWQINETTNKTDSITVTWVDPDGKTHTVTNSTQFQVPAVTPTPLPSDDSIVVQFPLLPTSDVSNAILFTAQSTTGGSTTFQLDTGAFELMLNEADAKLFNAPNLGATAVQGVGGQSQAYYSQVDVVINGVTFKGIKCVVDPDFTGNSLFGYQFFIDNKYELLVSQKHNTVTFCK